MTWRDGIEVGREDKEGGNVCVIMVDLHCCSND